MGWTMGRNPGAIEEQEAQGQREMCSEPWQLPVRGIEGAISGTGVITKVLPASRDPLFVDAELPDGWSIKPTDHSMWSALVDDNNQVVAEIFYKAAYYERVASIRSAIPHYEYTEVT